MFYDLNLLAYSSSSSRSSGVILPPEANLANIPVASDTSIIVVDS